MDGYTLRQVAAALRIFGAKVEPAQVGPTVSNRAFEVLRGERFSTLPSPGGWDGVVAAGAIGAMCRRLKVPEDAFYAALQSPLEAQLIAHAAGVETALKLTSTPQQCRRTAQQPCLQPSASPTSSPRSHRARPWTQAYTPPTSCEPSWSLYDCEGKTSWQAWLSRWSWGPLRRVSVSRRPGAD